MHGGLKNEVFSKAVALDCPLGIYSIHVCILCQLTLSYHLHRDDVYKEHIPETLEHKLLCVMILR